MSRWRRRGLLELGHCLTPTPVEWRDGVRVYYGAVDAGGRGHVSFLDVDARDPSRSLGRSERPLLGPGAEDAFDRDGVVPSAVVPHRGRQLLYYSGFRRGEPAAPYTVFTGVAEGDGVGPFRRLGPAPVLAAGGTDFRAACFVLPDGDAFRMWYLHGTGWVDAAGGKRVPTYELRHLRSPDPHRWDGEGDVALRPDRARGEVGFSRPWIVREPGGFRLWMSVRAFEGGVVRYTHIETLASADGVRWDRAGAEVAVDRSAKGWDSEMVCYPAYQRAGGLEYLFYAGNGNGRDGLGFAARG